MLEKFYKRLPFILIILYIITPYFAMIFNYFKLQNFGAWYLPNIISSFIGLYVICINIKNIKRKEYIIIFLLITISILSSIQAKDVLASLFGVGSSYESMLTFIGYIGFFYCGVKINEKKDLQKLANVFIIAATIIALLTLSKLDIIYKLFQFPKNAYYFYIGPFQCFNQFGAYLLYASIINLFMIIYMKGKKKIFYVITNLILVFTLVLNDTLSVFLTYIIVLIFLLFYFYKNNKIKIFKLEIIIILITFIFSCITASRDGYNLVLRNYIDIINNVEVVKRIYNNKDNNSDNNKNAEIIKNNEINSLGSNRGELWRYGIKYITKKPILGYGYENIALEYQKDNIDNIKPHNRYIEIAQNTGLISLILYIILFYLIFKKQFAHIKEDKIKLITFTFSIAYLINATFSIAFFNTVAYFYIVFGIYSQGYFKGIKNEK